MSLIACVLAVSACKREILTPDSGIPINGFEIQGIVTDRLLNVMPDVNVRVEYDLLLEDMNEPPSRSYIVSGATESMQIRIYSSNGSLYKSIGPFQVEQGPFTYTWDEFGLAGMPAPPGVYTVAYVASGTEVLSYPVLLQGHVGATTDAAGRYTIPSDMLPVDFYPVSLFSDDGSRFYGNHRVSDVLYLYFEPPGNLPPKLYQVRLTKDRVVQYNVTY